MTSNKRQPKMRKEIMKAKEDNEESVDHILSNLDHFIEGVYRELSLSRSTIGNTITDFRTRSSVDDDSPSSSQTTSSASCSLFEPTLQTETGKLCSPLTRRNIDEEVEKINRICDNVDQNLRSVGIFMNNSFSNNVSEDFSNTYLSASPSQSASIIISNQISRPVSTMIRNSNLQNGTERRRSSPMRQVATQIIDLSNIKTPELPRKTVRCNRNNVVEDDDVILVSSDIPSIVDLCSPIGFREKPREVPGNYKLNRRRSSQGNAIANGCCEGPSSVRRRRTEISYPPPKESTVTEKKKTDLEANTDRTPFMCPVCMESCLQRQPTSTVCGHVFCKKCIMRSIDLAGKCPICNKKISKKQIFRIYL